MHTPHRIVLIDDNRALAETLAEYFQGRGCHVRTAPAAAQGLTLAEDDGPCLVVSDIHMPGMDGLELLRRLRRRPASPAVLFLSSDEDQALAARALRAGAQAVLSKTMPPARLPSRR